MPASVTGAAHAGLERSCGEWLRSVGPAHGVELLEAHFPCGGFGVHRHDTYGVGVTDVGVQTFDYRGSVERSLPGQVTVLHPDESHDGRAGTDQGFAYRIVYVAPEKIRAAVDDLLGRPAALPFVRAPVSMSPSLAHVVNRAFRDGHLDPLQVDSLVLQIARGLCAADPSLRRAPTQRIDAPALRRVRDFLHAQRTVIRSTELEEVGGLSRYALARQFRALYGTSPYRYSLLRRLEAARDALRRGLPIVDVALAYGFADQAHFTRMFTSTYGLPPRRYMDLVVRAYRVKGNGAGAMLW